MTLTLLHKTKVSSLLNVYRNFGLNSRWLWGLIGVFTHISKLHSFLCPHFWARCLMLVTYRYWLSVIALKAEWLSGLWNYMYVFLRYLRFFQNPKKTWLFTFFWVVAHVFPNSGVNFVAESVPRISMQCRKCPWPLTFSTQNQRVSTQWRGLLLCPVSSQSHQRSSFYIANILTVHTHRWWQSDCNIHVTVGWRFGVAVTRWSRSTQLLYIEPG